jgi:hypothetical protein
MSGRNCRRTLVLDVGILLSTASQFEYTNQLYVAMLNQVKLLTSVHKMSFLNSKLPFNALSNGELYLFLKAVPHANTCEPSWEYIPIL